MEIVRALPGSSLCPARLGPRHALLTARRGEIPVVHRICGTRRRGCYSPRVGRKVRIRRILTRSGELVQAVVLGVLSGSSYSVVGDRQMSTIGVRIMPDVFDRIEWKVREIFGEEPVCVHVGDVKECEIKRHPTYAKFRAEAILAGVRSAASSRLWESIIAMGRLSDLDGKDTWRLVILDCIVPCFRSTSMRISRDFLVDLEEIRSAMVATALEVWTDTAMGVPPRHVRDRMVKAAFEVASGGTEMPTYRSTRLTTSKYTPVQMYLLRTPR